MLEVQMNNSAYVLVFAVMLTVVVVFTKEGSDLFKEVTGWLGVFRAEVLLVIVVLLIVMMIINIYNLDMNPVTAEGKTVRKVTVVEGFDADGSSSFCAKYQSDPHELHKQCQKFDKDSCNIPQCCIWLNGTKCVGGNEHGPTFHSDDDGEDVNIDYFHHQGRCRGNCPE